MIQQFISKKMSNTQCNMQVQRNELIHQFIFKKMIQKFNFPTKKKEKGKEKKENFKV